MNMLSPDEIGDIDESQNSELVVSTEDIDDPDKAVDNEDTTKDDNDGPGDDKKKPAEENDHGEDMNAMRREIEDGFKSTIDKFESEISDLRKENSRLGYALRKAEKGAKKEPSDDDRFTDSQLLQIMEEHGDDKKVLMQVMRQMISQHGKDIESSAEARADVRDKQKQLRDITTSVYPNAFNEGSETYDNVQKTKTYLGLESNPYGDDLSLAFMGFKEIPNLIKSVREQVKKEVLGEAVESKRRGKVKESAPADPGHKKADVTKTPQTVSDTAKRLGFANNPKLMKRYQAMVGKGGALSAEA